MTNKIFYSPDTQYDNTGDLLINKSLVDLLSTHGEIIVDDQTIPGWYFDALENDRLVKVSAKSTAGFNKFLLSQLLSKDKSVRYFLVFPPGHFSRKGWKNSLVIVKRYAKLKAFQALGCKIVRVGFSIGPYDKINTWTERLTSKSYFYYGLRDKVSIRLANKERFKNVHYFPDLAWAYKYKSQKAQNNIFLSFRSNKYGIEHDSEYLKAILNKLVEIFSLDSLKNNKIVIVYQVEYDRESSKEIFDYLTSKKIQAEFIEEKLLLNNAQELYSQANFVLSNRLHVLLLALQSGTISFPLINNEDNIKITSIINDNELGDLILNLDSPIEDIKSGISNVLDKREHYLNLFRQKREKNCQTIQAELNYIFN